MTYRLHINCLVLHLQKSERQEIMLFRTGMLEKSLFSPERIWQHGLQNCIKTTKTIKGLEQYSLDWWDQCGNVWSSCTVLCLMKSTRSVSPQSPQTNCQAWLWCFGHALQPNDLGNRLSHRTWETCSHWNKNELHFKHEYFWGKYLTICPAA